MTADLDFRCACGTVRGMLLAVSPEAGVRYVCHCDDCQAFTHFLKRADDVLDANAGTDVFQTPASRLRITHGAGHLACMKVTKGPLLRWYADCCNTPLANTYGTSKFSFMSVVLWRFDPDVRDRVLGPPSGHVWVKFAKGDMAGVKLASIPAMICRILARAVSARLSGDYRKNPLFDPRTGAPIAIPHQLTSDERAAIDADVDAWHGSVAPA